MQSLQGLPATPILCNEAEVLLKQQLTCWSPTDGGLYLPEDMTWSNLCACARKGYQLTISTHMGEEGEKNPYWPVNTQWQDSAFYTCKIPKIFQQRLSNDKACVVLEEEWPRIFDGKSIMIEYPGPELYSFTVQLEKQQLRPRSSFFPPVKAPLRPHCTA